MAGVSQSSCAMTCPRYVLEDFHLAEGVLAVGGELALRRRHHLLLQLLPPPLGRKLPALVHLPESLKLTIETWHKPDLNLASLDNFSGGKIVSGDHREAENLFPGLSVWTVTPLERALTLKLVYHHISMVSKMC